MKKVFFLLFATLLMAGCVRYDVTLNNGSKFTNVPKPKYDKERQVYLISSQGNKTEVRSSKVVSIEPHESKKSKVKSDGSDFFLSPR